MKVTKLLAAIVGVQLVVASFGLAIAGIVVAVAPDYDGWIFTGAVRMSTDAVALVGEDIDIDLGHHITDGRTFIGWEAIPARLEVEDRGDTDVFIGIASDQDAQEYLDGVASARVMSFDADPDLRYRDGADHVAPPTQQTFWVASAVNGTLEWDVTGGDWAIVVLNTDGSPGVDTAVTASARVPFLEGIGIALIVAGLAGMAAGVALTYYGVRRTVDPSNRQAAPPVNPVTAN